MELQTGTPLLCGMLFWHAALLLACSTTSLFKYTLPGATLASIFFLRNLSNNLMAGDEMMMNCHVLNKNLLTRGTWGKYNYITVLLMNEVYMRSRLGQFTLMSQPFRLIATVFRVSV